MPVWAQDAYLKASVTFTGDEFGSAVALSSDGTTLVVGGPKSTGQEGAVHVFRRDGGSWVSETSLEASNADSYDHFGSSLALSGDGTVLAVGALYEQSNATGVGGNQNSNALNSAGAAYVFRQSGGVWRQEAYVKASNTGAYDYFGQDVALSGDGATLAVGAPFESSSSKGVGGAQDNDLAPASGAVYVFRHSSGVWSQEAYVKASNTGEGDSFGLALALSGSGDVLAVGACAEGSNARGVGGDQNNDDTASSGAVFVFERRGSWSQTAYVKASNTSAYAQFGFSVDLSTDGATLIVGAPGERSNAKGVDGDQSNTSLTRAGAAYVFRRPATTWSQAAYVKASNTRTLDAFGTSVAVSGDGRRVTVGAPGEPSAAKGVDGDQNNDAASGSGAVYVFQTNGTTFAPEAYVKASNTGENDAFGKAMAVSPDGQVVAVGAPGEDSGATGINGNGSSDNALESGAAYILRRMK